jgi:broad specificity phosphatase PhoE
MSRLYLIKHAKPLIDEHRPSHEWVLSDPGREQAARLARIVRDRGINSVVTSTEPKASETGRILAEALGCPVSDAPDLHEHDRRNVPVMPTRQFISTMALFFTRPEELVLGRETAHAAAQRFEGAVDRVMSSHEGESVAIVTHGTVIALYVAALTGEPPFQLWRRMGLPSFAVIDWVGRTVERVVDRVEGM